MEDVVKSDQKWNFSGKVMSAFEDVCRGGLFLHSCCSSDTVFFCSVLPKSDFETSDIGTIGVTQHLKLVS